jgi:hypothetical protein
MIASAVYKLQRERNAYPIALINDVIPAQAGIHPRRRCARSTSSDLRIAYQI